MSEESIGKFAVAYVDHGDTSDGFPGILGVYDTLAEAVQDMLDDIRDMESRCTGHCTTKHSATTGELWYDEARTHGCQWKVVEI